jgi:hypothetical protein
VFVNGSVLVETHVGCGVSAQLIGYLEANVDVPRLEYFHLPARNSRYNPGWVRLSEVSAFAIGRRTFELITLEVTASSTPGLVRWRSAATRWRTR